MTAIAIDRVEKRFGPTRAVANVSLAIRDGEFFTLLGPSGCGKTTLLRMVAGFADLDGGEIRFGPKRIDRLPPHRRNTGMVFQNYAIFPNLTVAGNVGYGLKARRVGGREIGERVRRALKLVHLEGYDARWPHQLSGGQLQRVAIARALVIEPEVLLLDEPLSNLDAKLRVEMRGEIRELQRQLGITAIYVTHDQEEALAISDRIAVMRAGEIEQIGAPAEIYGRPATPFVAQFMGTTNLLRGRVTAVADGRSTVAVDGIEFTLASSLAPGTEVSFALRPETLRLVPPGGPAPAGWMTLAGRIERIEFLGVLTRLALAIGDRLRLSLALLDLPPEGVAEGSEIGIAYDPRRLSVFGAP